MSQNFLKAESWAVFFLRNIYDYKSKIKLVKLNYCKTKNCQQVRSFGRRDFMSFLAKKPFTYVLAIFKNLYTNCNIPTVQCTVQASYKNQEWFGCQEHVRSGSICGSYIISACPMGKAWEREGHGTERDGVDPPLATPITLYFHFNLTGHISVKVHKTGVRQLSQQLQLRTSSNKWSQSVNCYAIQ